MKLGNINFPSELIEAANSNQLVVFAGAGVSMGTPANLPSFWELSLKVAEGSGKKPKALGINNGQEIYESLDRFLGELKHDGINVHKIASDILTESNPNPTLLHSLLLKLFDGAGAAKIVTTNFDLLFENAAQDTWGNMPPVYSAPALPLGRNFSGIVHVHGSLTQRENIVLTDTDFGQAYLTDGWARRFLVSLFQSYTVLFIGYSHDDTVMQYLARALPGKEVNKRFAMTSKDESLEKWELLGINPIPFSKTSDGGYTNLYIGIEQLSEFLKRSQIDWKEKITKIANNDSPPKDIEEIGHIHHAMKEVSTVRYFTESAFHPNWLYWLNQNRYLENIFSYKDQNDIDRELSKWVAENFATKYPQVMFLLIGKHHNRVGRELWWNIAKEVSHAKEDCEYPKWVMLLLEVVPASMDIHSFQWLSEKSYELGYYDLALQCFEKMCKTQTVISEPYEFQGDIESDFEARIDVKFSTPHWNLNEVWEKNIKPKIDILYQEILSLCSSIILYRHKTVNIWNTVSPEWQADSYHRSAIEPHEQDEHPNAIDVVINACRDALEYTALNFQDYTESWVRKNIHSPVLLLVRLAIHSLGFIHSLPIEDKIQIIFEKGIHGRGIRHEVFVLLKKLYSDSNEQLRSEVIDKINEYPLEKGEKKTDRSIVIEKYQWFSSLLEVEPNCLLLQKEIEILKGDYPNIEKREYPDLTSWTSSGWGGPESPYTIEQLVSENSPEWFDVLLMFKGDSFKGPSREGLLSTIKSATQENFSWGIDFCEYLKSNELWDSDVWGYLIYSFKSWPPSECDARYVLSILRIPNLQARFPMDIADVIRSSVEDESITYLEEITVDINTTAQSLWVQLPGSKIEPDDEGWLGPAINATEGKLAEYWIRALSHHVKNHPRQLSEPYKTELGRMCDPSNLKSSYTIPIISAQIAFLASIDYEWTNQYIVPLFTNNNLPVFQQSWDGFLCWGRLTPVVFELLEKPLLNSLSRMADQSKKRKERFIEYYASALYFYTEAPLTSWVPEFYSHIKKDDRYIFITSLESCIESSKPDRKKEVWDNWLKKYWSNRTDGLPVPLLESECKKLIEWVPHLPEVFKEAVDLTIRMPVCEIEHTSVIYRLRSSEIPSNHPDDVSRLLVYLLGCTVKPYALHGLSELVQKIDSIGLTSSSKNILMESLIKNGYKWPKEPKDK